MIFWILKNSFENRNVVHELEETVPETIPTILKIKTCNTNHPISKFSFRFKKISRKAIVNTSYFNRKEERKLENMKNEILEQYQIAAATCIPKNLIECLIVLLYISLYIFGVQSFISLLIQLMHSGRQNTNRIPFDIIKFPSQKSNKT